MFCNNHPETLLPASRICRGRQTGCWKCNAEAPSRASVQERYRTTNKEQIAARSKDSDAKHRYGFSSHEEYLKMREQPCEICGKLAKKMCVDHEGLASVFNQTYRGILCQQCNVRLGWFERNKDIILAYLKRGSRNASNKQGPTGGNGDCPS